MIQKCCRFGTRAFSALHAPPFYFPILFCGFLQLLLDTGVRVVVVATKADKLSRAEAISVPRKLQEWIAQIVETDVEDNGITLLSFSATTGEGKSLLWNAIRDNLLAED
jgi:GTP-binding protein EngB required for normal cell division